MKQVTSLERPRKLTESSVVYMPALKHVTTRTALHVGLYNYVCEALLCIWSKDVLVCEMKRVYKIPCPHL